MSFEVSGLTEALAAVGVRAHVVTASLAPLYELARDLTSRSLVLGLSFLHLRQIKYAIILFEYYILIFFAHNLALIKLYWQ